MKELTKSKGLVFFVFFLSLSACVTREKVLPYTRVCEIYSRFITIPSTHDTPSTRQKVKDLNSFMIEFCPEGYEDLYFKKY